MRIASAAAVTLALCAVVALAGCNKSKDNAAAGNGAGTAATTSAPAGPMSLSDMPKRKPGLWAMTMVHDGVDRHMNMQTCIDAESDAKMAVFGQGMSKDMCSKTELTRGLDGSIHFTSTCSIGGGTTTSTGEASGDFSSHYTIKSESTTTGSPVATVNGHHTMTMDVQWTGPCQPGQKGGDVVVNGMTMHMGDMMNSAAAAKK